MGGLTNYLECESLLHEFFNKVNMCGKFECYNCCNNDNLPKIYGFTTKELDDERIKIYGEGKNNKPCPYLSGNSCDLKTHKPVVCISFACESVTKFLKTKGINYDSLLIENKLLEILIFEDDPCDLKKEIQDMIKKI